MIAIVAVVLGAGALMDLVDRRGRARSVEVAKRAVAATAPSIVGTHWSRPGVGQPDATWMPSAFSGGSVTFWENLELGADTALEVATSALPVEGNGQAALQAYEQAKQLVSNRFGPPSSVQEHNLYSQRISLVDCLRNSTESPRSDVTPSCAASATWWLPDRGYLVVEIPPGYPTRVLIRQRTRFPVGERKRMVAIP